MEIKIKLTDRKVGCVCQRLLAVRMDGSGQYTHCSWGHFTRNRDKYVCTCVRGRDREKMYCCWAYLTRKGRIIKRERQRVIDRVREYRVMFRFAVVHLCKDRQTDKEREYIDLRHVQVSRVYQDMLTKQTDRER